MSAIEEQMHVSEPTVAELAGNFFSTWAMKHASEMDGVGYSPSHPAQAIDYHTTPALMPSDQLSRDHLVGLIYETLSESFGGDEERTRAFMAPLHEKYPFEDGNDRSYIDYVVDEYLSQGKGISLIMGHADDGLTDVPRAMGATRLALADEKYGDAFLDSTGVVASKTVTYETWGRIPVPNVLSVMGRASYTAPQTDSVPKILELSGISQEEYDQLSEAINGPSGMAVAHDLRAGKIVGFSATGQRPAMEVDPTTNELKSLTMKAITPNTARMIGQATAVLPATVIGGKLKLGPVVPLDKPKGLSKEERTDRILQQVEDCMSIVAALTNDVLGKPVAIYARNSTPGDIANQYLVPAQAA